MPTVRGIIFTDPVVHPSRNEGRNDLRTFTLLEKQGKGKYLTSTLWNISAFVKPEIAEFLKKGRYIETFGTAEAVKFSKTSGVEELRLRLKINFAKDLTKVSEETGSEPACDLSERADDASSEPSAAASVAIREGISELQPEVPAAPVGSLAAFYDKMAAHNWFYNFSDDMHEVTQGDVAMASIEKEAKRSQEFRKLYEAFQAYKFSGQQFGTEELAKPVRPAVSV